MPRMKLGTFSIDVLEEWKLSTVILAGPTEEKSTILRAKTPKRFQQNLVATIEQVRKKETIESYLERQVDGLREAGVDRRELKQERIKLRSGIEGILIEQVVVVGPSDEWVHQMQFMGIKDDFAYTLIASHLDGEPFEQARSQFTEMLLSFELLSPGQKVND